MRIGLYLGNVPARTLDRVLQSVRRAEAAGFRTLWFGQLYDYEALSLIALAGRETSRIELGTWVVPTYPRHPATLAQQALTAQAASGGRLALAVGLSHRAVIEKRLGLDYGRPVRHMREYLEVLRPLLAGEKAEHRGEEFRVRLRVGVPGAGPPPLLLAALGPQMLRLAGRLADGAALWLGGPRYLEELAVPTLREAADRAGRPPPRIVAGLPVCVCESEAAGRAAVAAMVGPSAVLPSYRAVLEREGARRPEDVGLVGSESEVRERLARLAALGVADFNAVVAGAEGEPDSARRTIDFLAGLSREGGVAG